MEINKEAFELQLLEIEVSRQKHYSEFEKTRNNLELAYQDQEVIRRNLEVLISLKKLPSFTTDTVKQIDEKISLFVSKLSI